MQGRWTHLTEENQLTSLASEFDTLQEATSALRKKNEKAESKLAIMTGGYAKRSKVITAEILQMYGDLKNAIIEEAVYTDLREKEERGSVMRIDKLRTDIKKLKQDEAELQKVYQELLAGSQEAEALSPE